MQPRASRASSATPFHATTRIPTRASRSALCPTACASTPSAPRTSTASCAASLAALVPTASRPISVPVAKRASTATALALELPCAPYAPQERTTLLKAQQAASSCLPCEKGKYATMGAPQCLQVCRRGQEQLSNTECKDCPAGMTSDESPEPKCVECDFGKFAPTPGSRSCEKCPAGRKPSMFQDACNECPRNTYSLDGFGTCIPCKASEFSEPGSSRCAPCIPGQVVSAAGDSCESCPAGKQRDTISPLASLRARVCGIDGWHCVVHDLPSWKTIKRFEDSVHRLRSKYVFHRSKGYVRIVPSRRGFTERIKSVLLVQARF